jgi:predicted metalloprotease with PDZ domain
MMVGAACLFLSAVTHADAHAQTVRARIAVTSLRPAKLRIDLELPPTNVLSFRNSYGMLVAFMYDLSLRNLSGCRERSDEIYRQLFSRQATGQENANETIIRLLSDRAELQSFVAHYVRGTEKIDLETAIARYGLQVIRYGLSTKLLVAKTINKEQRKLLKCIGYRG